jgi:hypothetical protein
MDANIAKALNDKLYDKRKSGALEYVFLSLPRTVVVRRSPTGRPRSIILSSSFRLSLNPMVSFGLE